MRYPLPHRHGFGQHEQLRQELHGAVGGDARHRRELIECALELGMCGDLLDGLGGEELDAALEVPDVHRNVVGHHGEMLRGGGQRMEPITFAGPLHDQRGDTSRHGPQLEHRRRGWYPGHERHARRILAERHCRRQIRLRTAASGPR